MENRYVCPVCGGPQVGVGPCPCFVNHLRERERIREEMAKEGGTQLSLPQGVAMREASLEEFVGILPEGHRARNELAELRRNQGGESYAVMGREAKMRELGLLPDADATTPHQEGQRVVQPEDLHVKVGNLEIRRRPREGTPPHVVFGSEVEFLLDGKPFAVRSLGLHFDMKSPVTAKIEIFVKDVKDMAQAVINGQSINGPSFEITSATFEDDAHPTQRCYKCGWPPSAYGCTTEQCKRK